VSLVLVAVLFAPAVLTGDSYELIDSLVFLGAPLVLAGTGVGALVGARPAGPGGMQGGRARQPLGLVVVAGVAVILAVWTTAWATGLVDVAPLGLG
jgi:hypothetical protein